MTFPKPTKYSDRLLKIATSRGWKEWEHREALERNSEWEITMTHPYNYVTEEELSGVEQLTLWGDE